ncbi:FAD-dependent oxidoreductase [uncultured Roseobacter sp.]|uniref:NAD(P)/FAD-dependent oxidoreductase n=1 Tax=uncultured Roseobacter sp. TaxID=114847 RepID=UPI002617F5C5|nr:FAD-dependent oxidoreductase [uncultured Roseobacter sp.]
MKVIVVGAGVIGAVTAWNLARSGAQVTVIEAGAPAQGASGASFGWINASFYADEDHFHLRHAAFAAHRRLADALGSRAVQWQGCLCWEEQGAAFDAQSDALRALGYNVREIDRDGFTALEPGIPAPERALLFADEGAVDLVTLTQDALAAACALGARIISGVPVQGLVHRAGRIAGVTWSGGTITADHVMLATGTATGKLLDTVDARLPMPDRPGLILRTAPLPPLLSHILVSPGQELRQLPDGRLLAPTAAAHQSDTSSEVAGDPSVLADRAAARVSALIGQAVRWEEVTLAWRPVPGDGLPVIGACGPEGLYVTTMHSGATLAPLVGEIAAAEIMGRGLSNTHAALVAPYRPARFTE